VNVYNCTHSRMRTENPGRPRTNKRRQFVWGWTGGWMEEKVTLLPLSQRKQSRHSVWMRSPGRASLLD
jgi:hypothetical protein